MRAYCNHLSSDWSFLLVGAVSVVAVINLGHTMYSTFTIPRKRTKDAPQRGSKTVTPLTVYVLPGFANYISASPFSTKLLTYLRLTGVPFKVGDVDMNKTPKGKFPSIEHEGNLIGDTQLIIRYICRRYI
jgi:hypothetical protein